MPAILKKFDHDYDKKLSVKELGTFLSYERREPDTVNVKITNCKMLPREDIKKALKKSKWTVGGDFSSGYDVQYYDDESVAEWKEALGIDDQVKMTTMDGVRIGESRILSTVPDEEFYLSCE